MITYFDTFDGAKPRFLNRGKKRRSVSTLSIPRALVLSAVEGSDRGVEWVDFLFSLVDKVNPEPRPREGDLALSNGLKENHQKLRSFS
jgi:hypothetical protein